MDAPNPEWAPIQKIKIPAVRRGTSRRRAKAGGMHMSTFWQQPEEERQMIHAISRAGRRPNPRTR
jgi:hypothetical protein